MPEGKKTPEPDTIVSKIITDPARPPEVLLLAGYVGESSEEGYTRLYLNPQLSDYVEIPTEEILHAVAIPITQSPFGGTYLWVNKKAQLLHGRMDQYRFKARFLEGRIQQAYQNAWNQEGHGYNQQYCNQQYCTPDPQPERPAPNEPSPRQPPLEETAEKNLKALSETKLSEKKAEAPGKKKNAKEKELTSEKKTADRK